MVAASPFLQYLDTYGAFAAIFCVILVAVILILRRRTPKKPPCVLLIGPCGGGKTAMFLQLRDGLRDGKLHPTHTSMTQNDDTFIFHEEKNVPKNVKPIRLVDLPGHHRLRPEMQAVIPQAAGMVLVVDVQDYSRTPPIHEEDKRQRRVQDAAEIIFEVMTNDEYTKKKNPTLLIACNKNDLVTDGFVDSSPSVDRIRRILEDEIEQLRKTRSSFMTQTDGKDRTNVLGVDGERFSFENCEVSVDFHLCSAKEGKMSAVMHYIRDSCK